jgi:hypothetical protein
MDIKKLILILAIFVYTGTGVVFSQVSALWKLPVPAGAKVIWEDQATQINGINARTTHIATALDTPAIISFYQQTLSNLGWEFKDYFQQSNALSFTKEKEGFVYVVIADNGEAEPSDVYIAHSPESLAICLTLADKFLKENIYEDVAGKDSIDIPRYPGSKRRVNVFAPEEGTVLMYEADAAPTQIASFYDQKLPALGWQKNSMFLSEVFKLYYQRVKKNEKSDLNMLFFEKGDETLLVNILPAPKEADPTGKRSLIVMSRNSDGAFFPSPEEEDKEEIEE